MKPFKFGMYVLFGFILLLILDYFFQLAEWQVAAILFFYFLPVIVQDTKENNKIGKN